MPVCAHCFVVLSSYQPAMGGCLYFRLYRRYKCVDAGASVILTVCKYFSEWV